MQDQSGVTYAIVARWSRVDLRIQDGWLADEGAGTRVSLDDGHVHIHSTGRLAIADAEAVPVVYIGQSDGMIVDMRTGFRVLWRGKGVPYIVRNTSSPTFLFEDGCEVVMTLQGVATMTPLGGGQLNLDCTTPRSFNRRRLRARRLGARPWGGPSSPLLMAQLSTALPWPPLPLEQIDTTYRQTRAQREAERYKVW